MADEGKRMNATIPVHWDPESPRAKANRAALAALMGEVRDEEKRIREGGGAKAAEAQRAKGRLTARERIRLLLDGRAGGGGGDRAGTGERAAGDDRR